MKRRNFLATVAGLVAAPFVAKKAAAPATKPYVVAVDWARDSVSLTATEICNRFPRIHVLKSRRAGYTRQQAEVMKELEKYFGKAHYQTLTANMQKTP